MKARNAATLRGILVGAMLLVLPLSGLKLAGIPLAPYFAFPPHAGRTAAPAFSWPAFGLIAAAIFLALYPFHKLRYSPPASAKPGGPRGSFPWWGWVGLVGGLVSWGLAWSRMEWFAYGQPHTFPMLWSSFILVVNAASYRRQGACLLLHRPRGFLLLFPASALFWWFFEYLNRFVQNWHYSGVDYPAGVYFILASVSFATVLPAVLSVREWLLSSPRIRSLLEVGGFWRLKHGTAASWGTLCVAGAGLLLVGIWPDYLFPILWVAPLCMILASQALAGGTPLLQALAAGRWGGVAVAALAGLVCGFFWELWNYYSLARWTYTIPWVDRFHVFEMPILGYAGYLPFGLLCAVVGDAVLASRWAGNGVAGR